MTQSRPIGQTKHTGVILLPPMSGNTLTAACDPQRWLAQSRADLLASAGLESQDLARTVKRHRRLLNAKKVKYFAHEGMVVDSRVDEDNDAAARAVDLMYDVLGVKAPRAPAASAAVGIEVVIEPDTGRVIVRAATTSSGQGKA